MSPRQRLVILPLVAVSLALSSCSGSDDAADPAATALTGDAVSTTVAEMSPPESTEPPVTAADTTVGSTDATTTEAATTTDAPTTVVESTTTAPSVAPSTPEEEVTAAIEFFEQQWKECLRALPSCDLDAVVERRGREDAATIQREAIRFNQNDYRASNIDAYSYVVRSVQVNGRSATASVCVTDPIVLTESDGQVVDDVHYSYSLDWTLTLADDGWVVESRTIDGETVEGEALDICRDT